MEFRTRNLITIAAAAHAAAAVTAAATALATAVAAAVATTDHAGGCDVDAGRDAADRARHSADLQGAK